MLVKKELFNYVDNDQELNWKDGLKIGTDLLIKNNVVTNDFYNSLIEQTLQMGAYYILRDGMALAHTKMGSYNLKTDLSIIIFKNPIVFENNKRVNYLITLSTKSANEHIDKLQIIAKLFGNDSFFKQLNEIKTYDEFNSLVDEFNKK